MSNVAKYQQAVEQQARRLCERPLLRVPPQLSELEWQAQWFSGLFGQEFQAITGERIELVQFGVWNHEAGPDFTDAAIRINGEAILRGAIELDTDVRDWERHGHASNAAYDEVVLHVFTRGSGQEFFTRTSSHRNVLQVRLPEPVADEGIASQVPAARPGRCVAPLRGHTPGRVRDILESAAEYRMRRKSEQLRRLSAIHGEDEALYQSLAAALGYKENKLPFTLLAQQLPLRRLKRAAGMAEALLFGHSGFLVEGDLSIYQEEARTYVRSLWEEWWPHRAGADAGQGVRRLWKYSGQRPANHPQRRLAALGQIVRSWTRLQDLAERCDMAALQKFASQLHHEYWDHHYTLTSARSVTPMALLGENRLLEMMANVFVPYVIQAMPDKWEAYKKLPARLSNRRVETAAIRLFGSGEAARPFSRTICHHQGLLQIYHDFCMQDESDCQRCGFPEQVLAWPADPASG